MKVRRELFPYIFAAAVLLTITGLGYAGSDADSSTAIPSISDIDKLYLPKAADQFKWSSGDKLAAHRNMNVLFPSKIFAAGQKPYHLPKLPDIDVTYQYGGTSHNVNDYISRTLATGLLVIKDEKIVLEKYALGNNERTVWTGRSLTKSVTSTLLGMAIRDGYIKSIDDPVTRYVPELVGSHWDNVSIRQAVRMTSGTRYTENPQDPTSDVFPLQKCTVNRKPGCFIAFLKDLGTRAGAVVAPPGTLWNYSSADPALTGIIIQNAAGMDLAAYLEKKVWKPFGMEKAGYFNAESENGYSLGPSGFAATLRDWGRFALYVMNGGVLPDGTKTLPDNWRSEALTPSQASLDKRTPYGYYWWLPAKGDNTLGTPLQLRINPKVGNPHPISNPGDQETVYGIGSSGQMITINPVEKVIVVKWAVWGPSAQNEDLTLFAAIINKLNK